MGTSSSSLKELQDNKYLQSFSGKGSISPNDPFWNQLLSFTFIPPHNCADCRLLEDSTRPMLHALLNNNLHSGNIASLVHVFLTRSSELRESVLYDNKVFIWQTYNSLFILRSVLKYFIETVGEDSMLRHLSVDYTTKEGQTITDGEKLLEHLINALIEIIVDVSVGNVTYAIIVEAVNTLLILLSVQMFSTRPAEMSAVYRTVMLGKCNIHAFLVIKVLISHYVNQDKCPHCVGTTVEGGGLIAELASGIWNMITFGYVRGASNKDSSYKTVLANQSLLLLLVLVNHCTSEKDMKNPYREVLFSFCGIDDILNESLEVVPSFRLDYNALFSTLCKTLKNDQTTLLAYLLLHKNSGFKQYVILCPDIETLIVPLLKVLYDAHGKNSHHIYMALIVLLILSEDEYFDKHVHHVKLKNVSWYIERNLTEITLGGLIVLILTRTIQYNMTRMHDKYLHTNCLAALANMSAYFQNLHPYVCQKFISLLEVMVKKQARVAEKIKSTESRTNDENDPLPADLTNDMAVLEEVIRMLLEILNSCLSSQLKNNTNLLYAMLYNQHVFSSFHAHPCFEDIMYNINKVVTFFSGHVQNIDQNPSVSGILQLIHTVASEWPKDKLKKFPELKFKYVEEGQPEDFFIPYLWSLVFHASDIYWNPENILIFNPHKGV